LDASTKATGTTHKRAREKAEYGPSNVQIESHITSSGTFSTPSTQSRHSPGRELWASGLQLLAFAGPFAASMRDTVRPWGEPARWQRTPESLRGRIPALWPQDHAMGRLEN